MDVIAQPGCSLGHVYGLGCLGPKFAGRGPSGLRVWKHFLALCLLLEGTTPPECVGVISWQ